MNMLRHTYQVVVLYSNTVDIWSEDSRELFNVTYEVVNDLIRKGDIVFPSCYNSRVRH